jgi:UMF1 family MFS transporter
VIAYFFYIDGVYTIISMASIFGKEVGLATDGMILALLFTQFIAFPFAILAAYLAKKFDVIALLKVYVLIYAGVAVFGFFLASQWQFWVLAGVVGIAQGGVQSLSRSFFGKLVPKENSNEYFGFYDIFGKYADLLGPILIAISGIVFKQSRYAILFLVTFFIVGYVLLSKVEKLIKNT